MILVFSNVIGWMSTGGEADAEGEAPLRREQPPWGGLHQRAAHPAQARHAGFTSHNLFSN